jgi:DNA-binding MarR family transcriptional regulator
MTVAPGNIPAHKPPDDEPRTEQTSRTVIEQIELELAQLLRRAERTAATARHAPADAKPSVFTGILDRSAYLLLHDLLLNGPENVNTLAAHLGLDASTVTRQVVAMERAGLARRTRDPLDGRAVVVEPTSQGLDDLARHREMRAELYAEVLSAWSRPDRALLAKLLERLNDDLETYKRARRD